MPPGKPTAMTQADLRGLGGQYDSIALRLGGQETRIYENYSVQLAVLQQPAAFSLRLGWSKTARELLEFYRPGQEFQLLIGDTPVMTGITDARSRPRGGATIIELRGKDYVSRLFKASIPETQNFTARTYAELTRKVLDKAGYADKILFYDNTANKNIVGKVKFVPNPDDALNIEELTVKYGYASYLAPEHQKTGSRMVLESIKAKIGATWWNFLQEQYKLVGLYLWCTGAGDFVLGRPDLDHPPAFEIVRRIKNADGIQERNDTIDAEFSDDRSNRHSECIVYGRFGQQKQGRKNLRGYAKDAEMIADGFNEPIVIHDTHVKTLADANYLAARTLAEERRMGWTLSYTFAGHRIISTQAVNGKYVTPMHDMTVKVEDDEHGFDDIYYIENVAYARQPQTTTTIQLMRRDDVRYLAETRS